MLYVDFSDFAESFFDAAFSIENAPSYEKKGLPQLKLKRGLSS